MENTEYSIYLLGKFVGDIEGSLYLKPRFNKFLWKKSEMFVIFQHPAFLDLNNFCNKHVYTKLLSQFRAVHSYGTRNTRTGKQTCLKVLYT